MIAYVADAAIIASYFFLNRTGRAQAFNWANALGAFPIIATEIRAQAWEALVLTSFFGMIGWYGIFQATRVHRALAPEVV